MKATIFFVFWFGLSFEALSHGRSEEMERALNAPVPEWMSLAKPIMVESIRGGQLPNSQSFLPRSGGAHNSRTRVQIPDRDIEFQVDYPIDWTGNNSEGLGVSLNPNGTKLIVNSGLTPHLYEISPTGDVRETSIMLPHITYDDGLKGFIGKWSWAGNDALIGRAGITDEPGHEMIERRLYVFHLEEQALARLDLSALNLSDTAGLKIVGIGSDLSHLQLQVNGQELSVKADLKSPPELLAKKKSESPSSVHSEEIPRGEELRNDDEATPVRVRKPGGDRHKFAWPLVLLGGMVVLGGGIIVIRAFLRRRTSRCHAK